jgi:hypothetical protein
MPFEYVNRRGEKYFLLQGTTKTGKPKFYVSRKAEGVPVDKVPDGYEIHENPERGIVSVRKLRPTKILSLERESLARWTRVLAGIEHFIIDLDGDSMVIYTPNTDSGGAASLLAEMFGGFPGAPREQEIANNAHYTAMLRFTLTNEKKRLFTVDRWCFRGSIDDWFFLDGPKPLEALARTYLPHLNRESFFELM